MHHGVAVRELERVVKAGLVRGEWQVPSAYSVLR
jgi:hypothetical protein